MSSPLRIRARSGLPVGITVDADAKISSDFERWALYSLWVIYSIRAI